MNPGSADYTIGRHSLEVDGGHSAFVRGGHVRLGTVREPSYRQVRGWAAGRRGHRLLDALPRGRHTVACGPWSNQHISTVDGLVEAVTTAPGIEPRGGPSDVSLGERAAKHLRVVVREDLGCDPGYFFNWRAQSGGALWQTTGVDDTLRLWILDLDGTLFFVVGQTNVDASQSLEQRSSRSPSRSGWNGDPEYTTSPCSRSRAPSWWWLCSSESSFWCRRGPRSRTDAVADRVSDRVAHRVAERESYPPTAEISTRRSVGGRRHSMTLGGIHLSVRRPRRRFEFAC